MDSLEIAKMSLKLMVDHFENTPSDRRILSRKLAMSGSPFRGSTKLAFKKLKKEGFKTGYGFWEDQKYFVVMYKDFKNKSGHEIECTATIIETPKCTGRNFKKCKVVYDCNSHFAEVQKFNDIKKWMEQ